MAKLYKRRYDLGAVTNTGGGGMDYAGLGNSLLTTTAGLVQANQVGKRKSVSGTVASDAATGAEIGAVGLNPTLLAATGGLSALAVPAGALIGGTVGFFRGKEAVKEQEREDFKKARLIDKSLKSDFQNQSIYGQASANSQGYTASGAVYEDGGKVHIKPSHKGLFTNKANAAGESVQQYASHVLANKEDFSSATVKQANFAKNASKWHKDGSILQDGSKSEVMSRFPDQVQSNPTKRQPTYLQGGKLDQISNNTHLAQGKTHEQGGIKLDSGNEIEGGETVTDNGDSVAIMSNNLVNPVTGNTFAKDDLQIAKEISKLEAKDKLIGLDNNKMKALKLRQSKLQNLQQAMNGNSQGELTEAKNGMVIKYGDGTVTSTLKGGRSYKGGSGKHYNINSKGERFESMDGKNWTKVDKFNDTVENIFNPKSSRISNSASIDLSNKDRVGIPSTTVEGEAAIPNPTNTIGKVQVPYSEEDLSKMDEQTTKDVTKVINAPKRQALYNTGKSLGKLASYTAPALINYATDRSLNEQLSKMNIPAPVQSPFLTLNKVNMENDRAAVRTAQANYNASMNNTISDPQTAALLKANAMDKTYGNLARINQNERNANIQIGNEEAIKNLSILNANKENQRNYELANLEKNVDLAKRKAQTTTNLVSDLRDVQNTYRQEGYADTDLAIRYAGLDDRAKKEFDATGATKYWEKNNNPFFRKGGKLMKLKC